MQSLDIPTSVLSPEHRGLDTICRGLKDIISKSVNAADQEAIFQVVDEVATKYERIYGTRLYENPTPDVSIFLKTCRGGAILTRDGQIKTCENMVYPDMALFDSSPEERAEVFGETKWTNKGTLVGEGHSALRHITKTTILDGDGYGVTHERSAHIMTRALNFMLSNALKDDEPAFLEKAQTVSLPEQRGGNGYSGLATFTRRIPDSAILNPGSWDGEMKPEGEWYADNSLLNAISLLLARDAGVYREAVNVFRNHLDFEVKEIMKSVADSSVKGYNWLCGFDLPAQDRDKIAQSRRYNVKRYPLAYKDLQQPYGSINTAINSLNDVTEELAKFYSISEERMAQFEYIGRSDFRYGHHDIDPKQFYTRANVPEDGSKLTSEYLTFEYLKNDVQALINPLVGWGDNKDSAPQYKDMSITFAPEEEFSTQNNEAIEKMIDRVSVVAQFIHANLTNPLLNTQTTSSLFVKAITDDGQNRFIENRNAYGILALANGCSLSEFARRVNDLYDHAYDIRASMNTAETRKLYNSLDMRWGSVFGKQVSVMRLPSGLKFIPFLSDSDVTSFENRNHVVLPSAIVSSYARTTQFAAVEDDDGTLLGVVQLNPEAPRTCLRSSVVPVPALTQPYLTLNGSRDDLIEAAWELNNYLKYQNDLIDRDSVSNLKMDAAYRDRAARDEHRNKNNSENYFPSMSCCYRLNEQGILLFAQKVAPYLNMNEFETVKDVAISLGNRVRGTILSAHADLAYRQEKQARDQEGRSNTLQVRSVALDSPSPY